MRKNISEKVRREVTERAFGCCEYCQCSEYFSPTRFAIEHIKPISKLGSDDLENLALACLGCNGIKYNKVVGNDILTNKEVPLFNPRKQKWTNHFVWNDDLKTIRGLTPTGRATVFTLKLNRKRVQIQRELLLLKNEHPPSHTLL